jgi:hypothetical protein
MSQGRGTSAEAEKLTKTRRAVKLTVGGLSNLDAPSKMEN